MQPGSPQHSRTPTRRRPRGYSLTEIAVVLAVVAVTATFTWMALGGLKARATFNAVASQLAADLNAARQRAVTEQARVVVVFLHAGSGVAPTGSPDRYIAFVDRASAFDIATFTPSWPAQSALLFDRQMSAPVGLAPAGSGSYAFGPPSGGNAVVLPVPFSSVPAGTPCTFGQSSYATPYDHRCAALFQPDGSVLLPGGVAGGSVSVADATVVGRVARVALVAGTGAVRSFQ